MDGSSETKSPLGGSFDPAWLKVRADAKAAREDGSELGIFILWSAARAEESRILSAIEEQFSVHHVYEITWTPELVLENFARFYQGSPIPPHADFIVRQKGDGPFLVVVVSDHTPRYEGRATTHGWDTVSVNFFDAKERFREWLGGGKQVHGTDDPRHAARDLMLLLGNVPANGPGCWDGVIQKVQRDVSGAHGWDSLEDALRVLNHSVPYVVLRNFEGFPKTHELGPHDDVDILTDDYFETLRVLNARPLLKCVPRWGGRFWVTIAGRDVIFDVRMVGDWYYDPKWARTVLARRVWHEGGFYAPCDEDYLETLFYHAFVHKLSFTSEYKERLSEMATALGRYELTRAALDNRREAKRILDELMRRKHYRWGKPKSPMVFYNFAHAGHRLPRIRRLVAGAQRRMARFGSHVVLSRVIPLYRALGHAVIGRVRWFRGVIRPISGADQGRDRAVVRGAGRRTAMSSREAVRSKH